MFNDLFKAYADKNIKEYKENLLCLEVAGSRINGYFNALIDVKEFNTVTSLILKESLFQIVEETITKKLLENKEED